MILRIATHCGQWGVFRSQEATPVFVGSIWDCIAYRHRQEASEREAVAA